MSSSSGSLMLQHPSQPPPKPPSAAATGVRASIELGSSLLHHHHGGGRLAFINCHDIILYMVLSVSLMLAYMRVLEQQFCYICILTFRVRIFVLIVLGISPTAKDLNVPKTRDCTFAC